MRATQRNRLHARGMLLRGRRSLRWSSHGYSSTAAYFVTICTHERRRTLGTVRDDAVVPSVLGGIAGAEWSALTGWRGVVKLDVFVVMPNHLHGIVCLDEDDAGVPLGSVIARFKSRTLRRWRDAAGSFEPVWQRGYHDHVIRDADDLDRVRLYVAENPLRWREDRYFVDAE